MTKFDGWNQVNNFQMHDRGRILVLWNPSKVCLQILNVTPQFIHCSL